MSKPSIGEALFLEGPAGRLEAMLEQPADDRRDGAAVVLHPHPQHGGTMHNKVAHTLARSFVREGFATLRFNFRGTGASEGEYDEGEGELDDALAAVAYMQERFGGRPSWLAGFSFGAAIAIRAAAIAGVDGLVSVAPAVRRFAAGLEAEPRCPWLIVQGDRDELVDIDTTIDWVNGLGPGPELRVLAGAEHFFHGRLPDLRDAVSEFLATHRRSQ